VSGQNHDLGLEGNTPVLAVDATLNGVAIIVDHENDRLEIEADHCRYFLNGQLAGTTIVRLIDIPSD
jgi:hypothetical protein